MSFQIPSHRNSVNRKRDNRAAWKSLVKTIPAKREAVESPAPQLVLRTPLESFIKRLDADSPERFPQTIDFNRAAFEIYDRVSFVTVGDLSAADSVNAILASGAAVYTKKAVYRLISEPDSRISNNQIEVSKFSC